MQRVHFISVGGAAMHKLAIAVCNKTTYLVTGSDVEISEPVRVLLKEKKIAPDPLGWFPNKIYKGLSAVVVGPDTADDNPELVKARELGLKIFSIPEYLYQQTRSKTRIVVGGDAHKADVTEMILFVLKNLKIDFDYMIRKPLSGFNSTVRLSYDARIAVIEGDEKQTSPLDKCPRFHIYKPHIAVLTGIDTEAHPDNHDYVDLYRKFVELMEFQGRLIYFDGDKNVNDIVTSFRRDLVPFPYHCPKYEVQNGAVVLKTRYRDFLVAIAGDENLINLEAARLACRQVGVTDVQFYTTIADFKISQPETTG